jgi:hypothetical protein
MFSKNLCSNISINKIVTYYPHMSVGSVTQEFQLKFLQGKLFSINFNLDIYLI